MAKPKVLHVDDEPDVLDLVRHILEKEGMDVISVESGEECLKKLKAGKVDLVLLDIMMPNMSGWEVLKEIHQRHKGTRVIFLTVVRVNKAVLKDLIADGLTDYIQKPCSNEEIVRRVKKALGMK